MSHGRISLKPCERRAQYGEKHMNASLRSIGIVSLLSFLGAGCGQQAANQGTHAALNTNGAEEPVGPALSL